MKEIGKVIEAINEIGVDNFIDEWYDMHMAVEEEMKVNEDLREMNVTIEELKKMDDANESVVWIENNTDTVASLFPSEMLSVNVSKESLAVFNINKDYLDNTKE